ncbi:hypothetical protein LDENG_00077210 [Lucifuga dentata]|nr:hypothetical protein LDENG_00077210 [Lucifuga dentata]
MALLISTWRNRRRRVKEKHQGDSFVKLKRNQSLVSKGINTDKREQKMAESSSPKGGAGDFAKKVQRQLSRGKEKVLQRLGKTVETRDEQFEHYLQQFNDQQIDGNRIYKDLKHYLSAIRDMRDASTRLSQSLFDAYETSWVGEEDLGAIVEGEDLLWNDFEVKLLDQAIRTMESYVGQFPDVREKVAKRGRKLVDYDSSCHHLEALQAAKKKDDIKINKAEEDVTAAKSIYEGINNELKEELLVFHDSRVGCYVAVFSAISTLRGIFLKEMSTLNHDLENVIKELQAQHPDKVFAVKGMQQYGSLKRRTLMSPRSWKASFSEFHRNYSPRPYPTFSFRSPDKSRHGTLSRDSSTFAVSPQSPPSEISSSEIRDLDIDSSHNEIHSTPAEEDTATSATGTAGNEMKSDEAITQVEEEEKGTKEGESEPEPSVDQHTVTSDSKGDVEKDPPSESSSEVNNSCDSESLELQLSAVENSPLHIEEDDDSPVRPDTPKANRLENGEVSGFDSDTKELSTVQKEAPAEKQTLIQDEMTEVSSCIGKTGEQQGKVWFVSRTTAHRKHCKLIMTSSPPLNDSALLPSPTLSTNANVTGLQDVKSLTSLPTLPNTIVFQVVTAAVPTHTDSTVAGVVIALILLTVAVVGFLLYRYLCHNKGAYRTTGELAPGEDPEEDHSGQAASEKKEYFI